MEDLSEKPFKIIYKELKSNSNVLNRIDTKDLYLIRKCMYQTRRYLINLLPENIVGIQGVLIKLNQ